jgi:hypothetical protein
LRLSMLKNFFLAHFYSPKKKTTVGKNELEKNAWILQGVISTKKLQGVKQNSPTL